jgi:hypothetical protein
MNHPRAGSHPSAPRLSEKEQEELRAAGKCFTCKEMGHLSRSCPKKNMIRSTSQRPPGTSAFNIELEPVQSFDSDPSVEILESLPVGAISFDVESQDDSIPITWPPLTEWREHYPYWDQPGIHSRNAIGDCYAMQAETTLTLDQPYPGDDRYDMTYLRPELRFDVVRHRYRPYYTIHDRGTNFSIVIQKSLLGNPMFDISRWYAKRRIRDLNLQCPNTHSNPIGPAIDLVATKLLIDGIASSYPCTNPDLDPENRF